MAANLFYKLPKELISLIFKAMDSTKDLLNLILASRHCQKIFAEAPNIVLLRRLKSAVPPLLWSEFCAANFVLSNFHPVTDPNLLGADEENMDAFLERYFGPPDAAFELPRSMESVAAAHKLHCAISSSIVDLTQKMALEAHRLCGSIDDDSDDSDQESQTEGGLCDEASLETKISETEQVRLYRAFLRFEIYARLFRPAHRDGEVQDYQGETQFRKFLSHFAPWEVEEITTVHQYLADIVENSMEEMDRDFEAEVRRLAAKAAREKAMRQTPAPAYAWTNFAQMDATPLLQFSNEHRWVSIGYVSSITASGIVYLSAFARSDKTARFTCLRRLNDTWGPFLTDALPSHYVGGKPVFGFSTTRPRRRFVPFNPFREVPAPVGPPDGSPESPTAPNQGYVCHMARTGGYLQVADLKWAQLRQLGCVFWDAARLGTGVLREAICEVEHGNYVPRVAAFPRMGRAPEGAINHIRLPVGDYWRLEQEFGALRAE
ncbi:hypothetical protein CCM_04636 [Cordyceps militaris CM01]|uniref:F-box domain-containing protein n=1 Tax=Cordyceps militaris (strain CM01) TaxID=983644 RepID=G3JGD3_CORMM|nr:uncharacterized protein CCM_04636 [Cordyceps militaris CM01]EGX93263.1 hypothetical protein CCM_04636 [Cordyceps militaris CM01]